MRASQLIGIEELLMAPSLSPEFRLAAACAIWPPSNRRTEAIRAAVSSTLDWSRVLPVARQHQLVGLVHHGLMQTPLDLPSEFVHRIATPAMTSARENLAMAYEALRLQRLFDDADLPVLFVKGVALSALVYGNLSLRSGHDIDLLIAYEALPAAISIILHAGYRRFDPSPNINDAQLRRVMPMRKDLGFVHKTTGVRIELHWRLFLNPYAMAEVPLMVASRVVPLAGTAGLRTLGEEDLFAYLCMHGALHWWYRLKWLADVNALLASMSEDDIERLVRAAHARGTGRAAAQALLLCQRLLGTTLPVRLTTMLGKSTTARWLAATALNAMTSSHADHDRHAARFGTTRGSLSTFLLRRNCRYRLAELKIHLINQTDVLTVPLPAWLGFLYPVLRIPLWLWRHSVYRGRSPN
jgi:hypothetical protein